MKIPFAILLSGALLAACSAPSKISMLPVSDGLPSHSVKVIALTPDGGLLADAIGIELSNRGFKVIDATTTTRAMVRTGLTETVTTQPEALSKLRDQGIDAVLSVQTLAGYDQLPQSASVRVNSTDTGRVLAGMTWQNGWGGTPGSMADRANRRGLVEAAQEIADSLMRSVHP